MLSADQWRRKRRKINGSLSYIFWQDTSWFRQWRCSRLTKTGGMLATRRTVNSRRASKAVCYVLGTYNIQQHWNAGTSGTCHWSKNIRTFWIPAYGQLLPSILHINLVSFRMHHFIDQAGKLKMEFTDDLASTTSWFERYWKCLAKNYK